jgi:hypothetical protein
MPREASSATLLGALVMLCPVGERPVLARQVLWMPAYGSQAGPYYANIQPCRLEPGTSKWGQDADCMPSVDGTPHFTPLNNSERLRSLASG